jgi:hypothetical protein
VLQREASCDNYLDTYRRCSSFCGVGRGPPRRLRYNEALHPTSARDSSR